MGDNNDNNTLNSVLNKEKKVYKKYIYTYNKLLSNNKDSILVNYQSENLEEQCPNEESFLENLKLGNPAAQEIGYLLDFKKTQTYIDINNEIDYVREALSKIDSEEHSSTNNKSNSNNIFNNKQINLNIQNKLIYLIRYKYNLFLSIIFIIIFICAYLYVIPKLKLIV